MPRSQIPLVGEIAPQFKLPAFPDGVVTLREFRGKKNVVLYFYPRDNTPGCTTEACDFRDRVRSFESTETVVLGISTDSPESHGKFSEKHSIPFQLLSDEEHAVCKSYGVWVEKNMYGKKSMGVQRATFLIDKTGKIARVWSKVKVAGHVAEVAAAIRELNQRV